LDLGVEMYTKTTRTGMWVIDQWGDTQWHEGSFFLLFAVEECFVLCGTFSSEPGFTFDNWIMVQ